ncbi:MAG: hypothetical protein Q9165_000738 [Trypethelium subeluteriae]
MEPNRWASVIAVPMNQTCNNLVQRFYNFGKKFITGREFLVTRLYPLSIEDNIIRRKANDVHPRNKPEIELPFAGSVTEMIAGMQILRSIRASIRTYHGIGDKRMTNIKLALGTYLLRFAGHGDYANDPLAAHGEGLAKFKTFRDYFDRYMNAKDTWNSVDGDQFTKVITELIKFVLLRLDVAISTRSSLAEQKIWESLQYARFTAIEEAGRVKDADTATVLAHIHSPAVHLSGDLTQGGAVNMTPVTECNFVSQGKLSLMHRAVLNGARTHTLTEQSRFVRDINRVIFLVWYNSELKVKLGISERTEALELKQWVNINFGINKNVIWVNVEHGHTRTSATKSVFNSRNVEIASDILYRLLKDKYEPKNIAILAPYEAQYRLYCRFDTFQGGERSIVLVDFTVIKAVGFLTSAARLLNAVSRAKNLLVNIGAIHDIDQIRRLRGRPLKKYITKVKDEHALYE